MVKQVIYFLIALLILSGSVKASSNPSKGLCNIAAYLFDEVVITGATNVNQFHLSYRENTYTRFNGSHNFKDNGLQICIPVRNIEAESQLMLDDFLDMINADKHPEIRILMNPQPTDRLQNGSFVKHRICLTMNGKTNVYNCSSDVLLCEPDKLCLKGKLDVLLTDFGIEPPRKFFGLVKVKNEVFVSFKVLFSTID